MCVFHAYLIIHNCLHHVGVKAREVGTHRDGVREEEWFTSFVM